MSQRNLRVPAADLALVQALKDAYLCGTYEDIQAAERALLARLAALHGTTPRQQKRYRKEPA